MSSSRSHGLILDKVSGLTDFMSFPVPTLGFHAVEEEVEDFVRCVLEGKAPECNVVEGVKTISTCLAIEQSIKEGQFVHVENDL